MYYNNERKLEYFKYVDSKTMGAHLTIKYIFSKLRSVEEQWTKDICDFTLGEIQQVLAIFNSSSINALSKNISVLKTYTDWCCFNKLSIDNINHYTEIDMTTLDKYVNKVKSKTVNKKELFSILDALYNDSDRFIALALFEGVRSTNLGEFGLLTLKDITEENGSRYITFKSGIKKMISDKLYNYAVNSAEEEVYVSIGKDGDLVESTLKQCDNIVKKRSNSSSDSLISYEVLIKGRLVKIREYFDLPYFTAPKLRQSGIQDNINSICKKYDITLDEFFGTNYKSYIKETNPNYGLIDLQKNNVKNLFK